MTLHKTKLQQQKQIMNEEIRKGVKDAENGQVYYGLDFMDDLIAKYESRMCATTDIARI